MPPGLAALMAARMAPRPTAPGQGTQGGGMAKVGDAIQMLTVALGQLAPGSDIHRDVNRAIGMLSKHAGGASGQPEHQRFIDMARNAQRNMQVQRLIAQRAQGQTPMQPTPAIPGQ